MKTLGIPLKIWAFWISDVGFIAQSWTMGRTDWTCDKCRRGSEDVGTDRCCLSRVEPRCEGEAPASTLQLGFSQLPSLVEVRTSDSETLLIALAKATGLVAKIFMTTLWPWSYLREALKIFVSKLHSTVTVWHVSSSCRRHLPSYPTVCWEFVRKWNCYCLFTNKVCNATALRNTVNVSTEEQKWL